MKLPAAYKSVTLYHDEYAVTYPPLGFCPFAEHQLGNGDTFGLYWPIGHENRDPLVAETCHDEWSLQPHYSSLDCLLEAVGLDESDCDDDALIETPTLEEDALSPLAGLNAARTFLKSQNFDAVVECLEKATSVLPEYTDAQSLLCTQYRRLKRHDAAVRAAIQALISPPCFGMRPVQIAQWLSKQSSCPADLESDPIWLNRQKLTLKFGGTKENDEYKILMNAINCYLEKSAFIPAMTLMQTYAELMYRETISFQERQGFDAEKYSAWQRDVAVSQYGKSRVVEIPDATA